jgi:hypothetical protein
VDAGLLQLLEVHLSSSHGQFGRFIQAYLSWNF